MVAEITPEERAEKSFKNAIRSLQKHFASPSQNGCVNYANFLGDDTQKIQAFAAVQEFLKELK